MVTSIAHPTSHPLPVLSPKVPQACHLHPCPCTSHPCISYPTFPQSTEESQGSAFTQRKGSHPGMKAAPLHPPAGEVCHQSAGRLLQRITRIFICNTQYRTGTFTPIVLESLCVHLIPYPHVNSCGFHFLNAPSPISAAPSETRVTQLCLSTGVMD